MSYIVLVSKDSFCYRLQHICDHFLKHLVKILARECNAQLNREKTFKQTIGNEGLHENGNNNEVT